MNLHPSKTLKEGLVTILLLSSSGVNASTPALPTELDWQLKNELARHGDSHYKELLSAIYYYTNNQLAELLHSSRSYTDQQIMFNLESATKAALSGKGELLSTFKGFSEEQKKLITQEVKKYIDQRIADNGYSVTGNKEQARPPTDAVSSDEKITFLSKKIDQLESKIILNDKKAMAGTATAIAIASMPTITNNSDNGYTLSLGSGFYEGQQAVAAGVSAYKKSLDAVININASIDSQNNIGIGAGASWSF
ncbi:YadA C-terminal domain-containing protein [Photobacterium leiognathi]|uniref:YadA C-terminal domain-containing protein n=1 Tax=Photobacterium leiognathi TaxID=553611 RepID=UPI001EDFD120|nr:YadA C-terminal domain-containing protein [Photobacterium leiognathi]MCG3884437.1 YadA C-terminal domain-containing protein [Photobacterium leiognathi]